MQLELCKHCGKPRMNCDCSNDSGFSKYEPEEETDRE